MDNLADMAMIFLSVQVAPADVEKALDVVVGLAYEASLIGNKSMSAALLLVQTLTIDDAEAISTEVAEQQLRHQVASALENHSIEHTLIGSGTSESSMTRSLFTIRPAGAAEDVSTLQIRADDRAEFEERLAALHYLLRDEDWPPQDLMGYEVVVEGLAAGDPDVQELPFIPRQR